MFKDNYSVKHSLKKLFLQRYERYLPTAFDESMSLLEKMNKLIESQNSIIDVVNNHVEFTSDQIERAFDIIDTNIEFQLKAFRDELEEQKIQYEEIRDKIHSDLLPDSVKQKLEEWLLNGTIEDLVTGTVFPELMERVEQVENRLEEKELLQEVNIKDYEDLVVDGNWHDAIMQALSDAYTVYFPIGEYTTESIVTNLSNREIKGSGTGTRFNFVRNIDASKHFHGFQIDGNINEIKRVTTNVSRNSDKIYLENTEGLYKGDNVVIKSQRNALSYPDSGDDWYLGSATNTQKLPFGEYATIKEVNSDHIVLSSNLIYPSYMSHNSKEENSAQDFSTVQKVDFVKNVVLRDFKVVDMYSGFAVRGRYCKNLTVDNVHFDDSNYSYASTGVISLRDSLDCEVRNSSYYTEVGKKLAEIYHMNVFKFANCQSCGVNNCVGENAGQTFDLTYFTGGVPNTGCYLINSKFINAMQSSATTHGGNYLTQITGNQFIGTGQGLAHRGRGGLISDNVFIGASKDSTGRLSSGVNLYEGGATDNVVSNNVIRNFNNGIAQVDRSPEGARLHYAGTQIIGNNIENCNTPIIINRAYVKENINHMGITIANNHIKMSNTPGSQASMGIRITRGNNGITIRDNIIKGIEGTMESFVGDRENNFYAIYCDGDVDHLRIKGNAFIDVDRGIRHGGRLAPSDFERSLYVQRTDNEYVRVRESNIISAGVVQYPDDVLK